MIEGILARAGSRRRDGREREGADSSRNVILSYLSFALCLTACMLPPSQEKEKIYCDFSGTVNLLLFRLYLLLVSLLAAAVCRFSCSLLLGHPLGFSGLSLSHLGSLSQPDTP